MNQVEEVEKAINALKEIRTKCGLSQERLAKELGYSKATVNAMERNKSAKISVLCDICTFFGISLKSLFSGDLQDAEIRFSGKDYQVSARKIKEIKDKYKGGAPAESVRETADTFLQEFESLIR